VPVAIDEQLLTLREMACILNCHRKSLHHWVKRGLLPRDGGARVRLRAVWVGKRLKTSRAWHEQFQANLEASPDQQQTPRALARQAEAEERRLMARLNRQPGNG
jgi:hypothetical protein